MRTDQMISKIVVGVDGSAAAAQALKWAIRLARCHEAEIVAAFAISPPRYLEYEAGYGLPMPVELDLGWRAQMKELFEQEWCKPLRQSGVRFRTVIDDGRPAALIAALADQVDADLVVVGRRGRGSVTELLLGSVSHELSHHCRRPVLLISAPSPTQARQPRPASSAHAS